ncbi:hypothetical protein TVAG_162890 [Trichomonas vaginalis G3]|uniref:Uncharacterized protein n=1 Tax=Trichomonas vaginalis (strain ATCC PRA-98 / G3) TaxID=412133 RepID=A2DFW7_TRIV3|nr:hypothetical protein TVAGG3_0951070 [Trichomonas vaginalis G3]EAY20594.1 hypothetical protein TVAG_162890 [Trichomonas vaginalis G3]KAI5487221.1 hypothetical protein TVAGG3_0951070 [Trichomonas vaginalis G3]|eukprot:XP_001581580.1 hypothetical protein [Trichomonas vaginalis G3]
MSKKELGQDGELADYDGQECGRVTPFSCYVRVMTSRPPHLIPRDERKKLIDSWKKLKDSYKKYYTEMANTKCGGNWIEEDVNELLGFKKPNRQQKGKTYGYQPSFIPSGYSGSDEQFFSLDDLIQRIELTLLMCAKKTSLDMDRWDLEITPKHDALFK